MTRRLPLWLALASLGCGEVYADLDVTTQATTDPVFVPAAVSPDTLKLLTIKARFDAVATAWVDSTGFDGTQGVMMAFADEDLGFSPGACPDDVEEVTLEVAEGIATITDADPIDEQGRYVFCGAIEVLSPEAGTLGVPIVFWNGEESVTGTGTLAIVETGL